MTHSSFNIVNIFYIVLKKLCEVVPRLGINGFYTRLSDKRYQREVLGNLYQMILYMLRSWNTVLFAQVNIYRLSGYMKV
jgi:hypothetical protein